MAAKVKKRILVVDDHPLLREALVEIINRQAAWQCCAEADNMTGAITSIRAQKPDLVVLDLRLHGGDGLDLLKNIRAEFGGLPVLVFSQLDESVFAIRCLRAGANGYLMKEATSSQVTAAVETVLAGDTYVSKRVNEMLLKEAIRETKTALPVEGASAALSDRELQVLSSLGHGLSTREIAVQLNLSPKTVETYRENLKAKLALADARALVDYARDWVERTSV